MNPGDLDVGDLVTLVEANLARTVRVGRVARIPNRALDKTLQTHVIVRWRGRAYAHGTFGSRTPVAALSRWIAEKSEETA